MVVGGGDNVSFQSSLEIIFSNYFYIFLFDVNFENLTIELYVLYVHNIHIKFPSNQML